MEPGAWKKGGQCLRRWQLLMPLLLPLLGVWCLQVQQVSGNTSFATGMGSLAHNKTLMEEIHKKRWMKILYEHLQRSSKEPEDDEEKEEDQDTKVSDRRPPGDGIKSEVGSREAKESNYQTEARFVTTPIVVTTARAAPRVNLPYFVFSRSPGKNILVFDLHRQDGAGDPLAVAKVNLWVYVWNKRPKNNRQRRKSKKGRLIKIRVFQLDDRSPKGKRIAELRKHVQSSNWHRLSLPVSLIRSLAHVQHGNNGTLKLRVRCKRCNSNTQLIIPSDAKRCTSDEAASAMTTNGSDEQNDERQHRPGGGGFRGRSLRQGRGGGRRGGRRGKQRSLEPNKKCKRQSSGVSTDKFPFMVIEDRTPEDSGRHRRSSSASSPLSLSSSSAAAAAVSSSCVEGTSSSSNDNSSSNNNNNNGTRSCCVLAIPVEPSEYGLGEAIVAPTTLLATACDGTCSSRAQAAPASNSTTARNNRRGRRGEGARGRRGKSRKTSCQPVGSQPLDVWFFDHNHDLVHASLPDMVVSQCGCRRLS